MFEKHRAIFDRIEALWNSPRDDSLSDEEIDQSETEKYALMAQVDELVRIESEDGKSQRVRDFKIQRGWFEYK